MPAKHKKPFFHNRRLAPKQRLEFAWSKAEGNSTTSIEIKYNVTRQTVLKTYNKLRIHGTVNDRPRSGRPTKWTKKS